jgi:hypothetical protein
MIFGVLADGFAQGTSELHVEVHSLGAVARTVADEPLLAAEAVFLQLCGAACGERWLDREAEAAGVDRNGLLCGTAQQAVDGRTEEAAAEIPEGIVEGADCHHIVARPRVPVGAVHLIPDSLDRQRVLPEEKPAK